MSPVDILSLSKKMLSSCRYGLATRLYDLHMALAAVILLFFFLSINISRDRNSEPEIHFNSRTQCVVARKYPNPHIYIGRIDFWRLQMASAATFSFTNKIADGANLLFSFMLHYAVDFVGSKRFIIGWKTAHLLALKK